MEKRIIISSIPGIVQRVEAHRPLVCIGDAVFVGSSKNFTSSIFPFINISFRKF